MTAHICGSPVKGDRALPCERVGYSGHGGESTYVPHPLIDGVWIGGAPPLDALSGEIESVVSLCRVGTEQVPDRVSNHVVRLIDSVAEDNPSVDFVIDDAARTVLRMPDEGRSVYLHCVAAHSRTPTVSGSSPRPIPIRAELPIAR